MAGYQVIDADGHVFEPEEMWKKYMAEPYKERAPRLVKDNWGHLRYMIEGRLGPTDAWMIRSFPDITQVASTRPGGTDPRARLRDMDQEGIDVAVLFASVAATALLLEDVAFAAAMCRAYNDWLADYCSADPRRLKGVSVVPFQDVGEAVKEMKRAKEKLGFVGVEIPPNARGKSLDDPYFAPFFAEAERLSVAVCIHETLQVPPEIPHFERHRDMFALVHAGTFVINYMLALGRLIYGGVLDRYPRLRIAFLECGVGWVPYWLERLDKYSKALAVTLPSLKKRPSEYIRSEQLYFHFEPDEAILPQAIALIGEDRLIYASDYPHWDAEVGAVKEIREHAGLSENNKRKLLGENAARFYAL